MARIGIDFAENCVRQMAKNAGEELASRVRVTRDPDSASYTVACGNKRARLNERQEPAEFARELSNAVDVVMGLREPKEAI